MGRVPDLFADGRGLRFALVAALAVGQAGAAAAAAFATRALFVRWHDGAEPGAALAALAGAAVALAGLRVAERAVAEDLGQRYAAAVRRAAFAHVARMPQQAVEARRAGGLMLRFTGDLAALSGWVSRGAARLVSAGIALPLTLVALAWLSPAAALGAALPLALGALATLAAGARLGPVHGRLRRRRARLAADMGERLRLAPLLRLAGRMPREMARLDGATATLRRAALARARRRAVLRQLPDAAGGLAAAGAALACWRAGASAAELAGALAALALVIGHWRDLAAAWDRRRASGVALGRLAALLSAPTVARRGPARRRPGRAALRFEGASAGPVGAFSARLRAGEKATLLGPGGSGKSTLLRLAAGLATPETGRVRVSGADPAALARHDRGAAILHLGPETPILAGSLRRALTMGAAHRPDDATLAALAARHGLAALLARIGGLDGRVAEGGRTLSEGERAAISVVRLALAPEALALVDGIDAHLDAAGREALAALLAARPGPVLCAPRSAELRAALPRAWRLGARTGTETDAERGAGTAAPAGATLARRRAVWRTVNRG